MDSSIKEVFCLFDSDGDGRIAALEIPVCIRALGVNPSEAEIDKLLAGRESDLFTFDDFKKLVGPLTQGIDVRRALMDSFKPFDRDGNGTINVGELKHVMLNLSEMKSQVESLINEIDPHSKGVVPYEQIVNVLLGA